MSRRRSRTSIEVLQEIDHEQWELARLWEATTPTVPEDWQEEWAETTMDVVRRVWRKQGSRLYFGPRYAALREDLQDWLMVTAQEIANGFDPTSHFAHDPEQMWGGYLWKALDARAHWHFQTQVANKEAAEALLKSTSLDVLNEYEAEHGTRTQRHALHGEDLFSRDPAVVYAHIEHLKEEIERADAYLLAQASQEGYTTATQTCEECSRPAHTRGLCQAHYKLWRDRWGASEGLACNVPDCPNGREGRGLCAKHLRRFQRGKNIEDLLPYVEEPRRRGGAS